MYIYIYIYTYITYTYTYLYDDIILHEIIMYNTLSWRHTNCGPAFQDDI